VGQTIPKLIDPSSIVKKYFDGTKPQNSVNFTDPKNGAQLTTLSDHLIQFFGQQGVLSCTDPTYPAYQGNSNMGAVHSQMGINNAEFDFFNKGLLGVMADNGVSSADRSSVLAVLETTRAGIVVPSSTGTVTGNPSTNPSTTSTTPATSVSTGMATSSGSATGVTTGGAPTFCSKYAQMLGITQQALVGSVVDGTVGKVTAPSSINKKYFDGTKPPSSTDFTNPLNNAKLGALRLSLIAFFGQAGVLGCNEIGFPKYVGPADLTALHAPMGISRAEFDAFNADLISVMETAGVSSGDRTTVLGVLESTSSAITPGSSTPSSTGLQGLHIGIIGGVGAAVVIAIIVVIVCCVTNRGKGGEKNYVAF